MVYNLKKTVWNNSNRKDVESTAAVYNIAKIQPNRSEMERPHSGGPVYVITVSPVPGKYAWLRWRSPALTEYANKIWFTTAIENPVVFTNEHEKIAHYRDHC